LRPCAREAGSNALLDARTFELGDCAQDVELQSPDGRGRVDTLSQGDEAHAELRQFLEQMNEVTQVAPETIRRSSRSWFSGSWSRVVTRA
jgi:hypothetical protein